MTRKHYIGAFTRRDAQGREQAICGQFVTPAETLHVGEETSCWGCAFYLQQLEQLPQTPAERARVLARITEETPWGVPFSI